MSSAMDFSKVARLQIIKKVSKEMVDVQITKLVHQVPAHPTVYHHLSQTS